VAGFAQASVRRSPRPTARQSTTAHTAGRSQIAGKPLTEPEHDRAFADGWARRPSALGARVAAMNVSELLADALGRVREQMPDLVAGLSGR
jgi:hypothetical protein